jgi:NADP-dependent 3-hydroxy acid dehydrogenase YdfG
VCFPGTFLEAPVSAFETTNRVNYLGVVHTLKAVLPGMVERCDARTQMQRAAELPSAS